MPSRRTPITFWQYLLSRGNPPPDLNWITDSLAVGGAVHDNQIAGLRELAVASVLDMRSEACDNQELLAQAGIRFMRLPTIDWHAPTAADLETGSAWIIEELGQGRKVLVHCQHGIGRSVIMAAAALVRIGYDWRQALRIIKDKRWGAAPNDEQMAALADFAAKIRQQEQEQA